MKTPSPPLAPWSPSTSLASSGDYQKEIPSAEKALDAARARLEEDEYTLHTLPLAQDDTAHIAARDASRAEVERLERVVSRLRGGLRAKLDEEKDARTAKLIKDGRAVFTRALALVDEVELLQSALTTKLTELQTVRREAVSYALLAENVARRHEVVINDPPSRFFGDDFIATRIVRLRDGRTIWPA